MFEAESDDMRTIKALPLWQAFLAAVIAPIIIALVFAILGAQKNALLLQIELIVVAIAFCLTGILARSKLLGLLSIFAAPISWVVLFFASTFTGGWFVNPYGLLSELAGPLGSIAKSNIVEESSAELMNAVIQIAIIVDLIILEFMALFLGFFLSTLATGIWTKKGNLSILSVIVKPIAAIFMILILITVPFIYHGIANFTDGGISLAAGAAEFYSVFGGELGNGAGAQTGSVPINLNDPEKIQELSDAAERAAKWFSRSAYKFDHVQGNFYIKALLQLLPEEMGGINMQKVDILLDISDILALVSADIPNLLLGYYCLTDGFNRTFTVLGESDIGSGTGASIVKTEATYNPNFNYGLENISSAINYFNVSREGVLEALDKAIDIVSEVFVGEGGELEFVIEIVEEARAGYGIILRVAEGAIDFLNATYETTLAIEDLGDSDFEGANNWMGNAAIDLVEANTTLRAIDISELDEESVLPFYGTVKILSDMTELLAYFAKAATNGTECYMEIEDVLEELTSINFADEDLETISADLGDLTTQVSETRIIFNAAQYNIGKARELSLSYASEENSYGDIIDGSLKPMLIDFSNMLSQFYTNVSEIDNLLTALDYTLASAYSFTEGLNLFNSTYNAIRANAGPNGTEFFLNFAGNDSIEKTKEFMDYAIDNASAGYYKIEETTVLSATLTTEWKNTLHHPYPPEDPDDTLEADPKSIAGLAFGVQNAIITLELLTEFSLQEDNFELINLLFDNMDQVGFNQIFGGG
ncbi:MAG: hypothetical protein ACFFB2_00340 [Promethearchaeota archaeon]